MLKHTMLSPAIIPPPFEWCEIPAGRVTLEDGAGIFDVQPFFMAKYLITYEQFQAFVDDPQGWKDSASWEGLAADAAHRKAPGKQYFTHEKNLPRENVSWYDAMAFCRWLTARVGYEVRLPTEWEWQWAAQGPDGREYPWGNGYTQGCANTDEKTSGIGSDSYLERTAPVGSYPRGASPYGALDMSGNVWEWCLNEFDDPSRIGASGDVRRALHGGSWGCLVSEARVGFRNTHDAPYRSWHGGFRVAGFAPVRG